MTALAGPVTLHRIRELAEGGKDAQAIAEALGMEVGRVRRAMRAYDIRPRRPLSVPSAPLRKLMGGR